MLSARFLATQIWHDDCCAIAPMRSERPALVLIADDNYDARDIYGTYFEYCGFRVATAIDGHEVVTKARELHPDVILLDLSMPGMDGWQAARALRADPATAATIIIALTGHAMKGSDRVAYEAGCDRYLIKPCLPDAAVAAVRDVLAVRAARRRPA